MSKFGMGFLPVYLEFAVLSFVHVVGILLLSVFLRMWRSMYLTLGGSRSDSHAKLQRLTLQDLFIYMACAAIIAAAMKPLFHSLNGLRVSSLISPTWSVTPFVSLLLWRSSAADRDYFDLDAPQAFSFGCFGLHSKSGFLVATDQTCI